MTKEELAQLQKKALEQFKSGKSLFGKDGAFAPMLKQFLEAALEAEMDSHLDNDERSKGNKRNGRGKKTIKSGAGSFELETPQDRQSSFEPEIIKKRETILADNLQDKIIGLYGLGMSFRDISEHIKEMYDTEISHTVLSQITDRIIPEVKAWQNRPLEEVYCIVWLDAMHYKVRSEGKVQHRALYNILGINFHVNPGTTHWNNTGIINNLTRRIIFSFVMIKKHTGRTVKLRDNCTFSTVDDEGSPGCHQGNSAKIYFLLLYITDG